MLPAAGVWGWAQSSVQGCTHAGAGVTACPSGLCHLLVFRALSWILFSMFFSSQEVSRNLTKENEQIKEDMEEIRAEMSRRGRENCSRDAAHGSMDMRSALQRDAAAAYAHPEVSPSPGPRGQHRPRAPSRASGPRPLRTTPTRVAAGGAAPLA